MANKYHCINCNLFVGEISQGAIRKNTVMLCPRCWKKAKAAIDIADVAAKNLKDIKFEGDGALDFLQNAFHMK